jgi:hypothetical protein
MSDQRGPNELWANIIWWYGDLVGKPLNETPGVWEGRAEKLNGLGPFDVKINGHKEEIDGLPPFGCFVGNKDYFPGVVCIVTPAGGTMIGSSVPGEDESGLIAFFEAHRKALTPALESETPE